ncbi:MAG: Flp pilus assembly complex ATPase component TadA [Magnetococcales bacterium]|nr:Flp pilus assembly complex ATPase component TadA [Magnetococcales bacterium]
MTTSQPPAANRRRLGEMLHDASWISQDMVHIALVEQKKTGELLGRILVRLGFVPEQVMRELLSSLLGQPGINLDTTRLDPRILALVPRRLIERHHILPVHWDAKSATLTLAMADTQNMAVIDTIQANIHANITIKTVLAGEGELARAIQKHFGSSTRQEMTQVATEQANLVETLLSDALRRAAAEILIEPEPGLIRIRYRVDGVLSESRALHLEHLNGLVQSIQTLAEADGIPPGEPWQGHFTMTPMSRPVAVRVNACPTRHGTSLMLQVREHSPRMIPLERLGLSRLSRDLLLDLLSRPEGMLLVVGPKGCGKSTTLRALMHYLDSETHHILTLNDTLEPDRVSTHTAPTEPPDPFQGGGELASLLAQEPDWMVMDEIRTPEQARLTLDAALAGQRILGALRSGSTLGAFPRLLRFGLPGASLSGALNGIIGQQRVRLLCPHCKRPHHPTHREWSLLGLTPDRITLPLQGATGCIQCHGSGFLGCSSILELLPVDAHFAALLEQGAHHSVMRRLARQNGSLTLEHEAIRLVLEGRTSLSEICRVVRLDGRELCE